MRRIEKSLKTTDFRQFFDFCHYFNDSVKRESQRSTQNNCIETCIGIVSTAGTANFRYKHFGLEGKIFAHFISELLMIAGTTLILSTC